MHTILCCLLQFWVYYRIFFWIHVVYLFILIRNTSLRQSHDHPSGGGVILKDMVEIAPQIAKFMGPTWVPPGSCWPQMGPMLAPWTLLSGSVASHNNARNSANCVNIYWDRLCHKCRGGWSARTTSLTLLPLNKNGRHFSGDIFICIFVNEMFACWLKSHWSLFLRVQLTLAQHCFR